MQSIGTQNLQSLARTVAADLHPKAEIGDLKPAQQREVIAEVAHKSGASQAEVAEQLLVLWGGSTEDAGKAAAGQLAQKKASLEPVGARKPAGSLKGLGMLLAAKGGAVDAKPDPWAGVGPDYQPEKQATPKYVLAADRTKVDNGWADPEFVPRGELAQRMSHENGGQVRFGADGMPQNPAGPTGKSGRLLGKWGPNHAGDPIIVRRSPEDGQLQMLAIRRSDTGEWAIPGGMVDAGEVMNETLARELKEETGVELDFADATPVYRGVVKDDPRNTDNAWMETTAELLVLDPQTAKQLEPKANDDASGVQWMNLNTGNIGEMYANHGEFAAKALATMGEKPVEGAADVGRASSAASGTDVAFTPAQAAAIDHLLSAKPAKATKVALFTDPNKDPDDIATYVAAAALADLGFTEVGSIVTTLGDQAVRTQRAQNAKEMMGLMGMGDVPVGVGGDYVLDEAAKKDHVKFLGGAPVAPESAIERNGQATLKRMLEDAVASGEKITLTVIAGMTDAAALLKNEPDLVKQGVESVVIMGGVSDELTADGHVKPDDRAYNNKTDDAAAAAFYEAVQVMGLPLTIVTKEAAYDAPVPRDFYEGMAKTGHPVGEYLHNMQQKALAGLFDGIVQGHIPKLTTDWFFKTFTDVEPGSADAKQLEAAPNFDPVWAKVTKLNLYDPMTLLASNPEARELMFNEEPVKGAAGDVKVVGQGSVKDPAQVRELFDALGVAALRGDASVAREQARLDA